MGDSLLLDSAGAVVPGGKITVLIGGSGAGKSVLLKTIAGILPRDGASIRWSGSIQLGDVPLDSKHPGHTGVVFQQFALFDELTPTANVQFAIDHRRDRSQPPLHSAAQWLTLLGVPTHPPVAALSGGQKQRLAIARTLAADPEIILYDEPTSGLDSATGQKVAELIRETQTRFGRTSLVVTHDYTTLLRIADEVLLLDGASRSIVRLNEHERGELADRLRRSSVDSSNRVDPVATTWTDWVIAIVVGFFATTGDALIATVRLPWDARPVVPRWRWAIRFLSHYLRLIGGPSACIYLIIAGLIAGFTTTYFTLRFLPFRIYTQPLLIDELLASIGFALYRILVPVLATVLIAARCGAAVAADVGVKQYGGQIDAMKTFGVRPAAYLLVPILIAFLIATPVLQWLAFTASHWISRVTFVIAYPEIGIHFWQQHFFRAITLSSTASGRDAIGSTIPILGWFLLGKGWTWVMLKNTLCGIGTAAIAYHHGKSPKQSAGDVSTAITSTVLWTTLYVLIVHFVTALMEF